MKRLSCIAILCLGVICAACSSSRANDNAAATGIAPATENDESAIDPENQQISSTMDIEKLTKVLFKTTAGEIVIVLYDNTPKHKENFIKLVDENFYDGILFHRIIQGFMIQTGDPDSKDAPAGKQLGMGGPGYTIPAEFVADNYHKRGAVAAARMGDQVNPTKASSGSQFYIVDGKKYTERELNMLKNNYHKNFTPEQFETYQTLGGAPFLDGDYTVFGEVIKGMDVVDKIAASAKDRFDRPTTDIKIISATIK